MKPRAIRQPLVVLPLQPVPCPACRDWPLILCQPAAREPYRLLGACSRCLAWWPVSATDGPSEDWSVGDRLDDWPEPRHAPELDPDRVTPDD